MNSSIPLKDLFFIIWFLWSFSIYRSFLWLKINHMPEVFKISGNYKKAGRIDVDNQLWIELFIDAYWYYKINLTCCKSKEMIISISISGHLTSCARFIIERSEIRKKQHVFKSVHFECWMVFLHDMGEKSTLFDFFP